MTDRIDLWEILIDGTVVLIQFTKTKFIVKYRDVCHEVELENINEIGLYKMDHMTHDTIMMYFKTDKLIIEIPLEIEIYKGELSTEEYRIEKYNWSCRVVNWSGFISWLTQSLVGFEKKWLNVNEPLLDSPSIVINYRNPHNTK